MHLLLYRRETTKLVVCKFDTYVCMKTDNSFFCRDFKSTIYDSCLMQLIRISCHDKHGCGAGPFSVGSVPVPVGSGSGSRYEYNKKKFALKQDLSILFFSMNLLNIAKVQDFFSFKKPVSFFWVELDSKLPSNFGSGGTLKRPAPQL